MEARFVFDEPWCEGVRNAIARARQQCTVAWSPKRECIVNDDGSWGYLIPSRAGRAQVLPPVYNGVPYSSTRVLDKLVGLDISFSTFVSATENPASIVYTRDLSDESDAAYHPRITNAYFTYGTVCSSLACYAMDLPLHYSTREWESAPELYEVAKESIDDIALADTLVTYNRSVGHTGGHVAVITSIARDSEGRVQRVEITEGWEPTQRYRWDSRKAFDARMLRNGGSYLVFRRKNIESVRKPAVIERAPTELMLDLGAFSAYREGDTVQLNVMKDADAILLESESGTRRIESAAFIKREIDGVFYLVYEEALPAGRYLPCLEKGGKRSEAVPFSVIRAPKPQLSRADKSALPLLAFDVTDPEGAPLTASSACLYKKDTDTLLRTAPFALVRDGKKYAAYGAVRKKDGKLFMHPSVPMQNGEGSAVTCFEIGAPVTLYLAAATEGETLTVDFSDATKGTPYSLCPKEEAAVTFDQRLLTEEERAAGSTKWQAIPSPYNRFVGLSVVCKDGYGKVTSVPYYMIIL